MTIIITHLIAFVLGGITGYLALRNNPKYKSWVDKEMIRLNKKKG